MLIIARQRPQIKKVRSRILTTYGYEAVGDGEEDEVDSEEARKISSALSATVQLRKLRSNSAKILREGCVSV